MSAEPAFLALAKGVLAIGCEIALRKSQAGGTSDCIEPNDSEFYFRDALLHRGAITEGQPSLLKTEVSDQDFCWLSQDS